MTALRRSALLFLSLTLAVPARAQEGPVKTQEERRLQQQEIERYDGRGQDRDLDRGRDYERNRDRDMLDKTSLLLPDVELIDVPTAGVLDHGGFSSRTRFFSGGGFLEWLNFGVFPRVNLGASLNIDNFIGTDTPVRMTRPDLQLKFRFYDGDRIIPAFALGYDGQGYLYNRGDKRYNQRQRGLYFLGSQEIGLPGLQGHAGVNISDFDSNYIFGFLAASANISDKALIMLEWDNIRNSRDSRLNTGLRIYVTPSFNFDFSVRGVGQGGMYSNGMSRGPERIVQFKYSGNF